MLKEIVQKLFPSAESDVGRVDSSPEKVRIDYERSFELLRETCDLQQREIINLRATNERLLGLVEGFTGIRPQSQGASIETTLPPRIEGRQGLFARKKELELARQKEADEKRRQKEATEIPQEGN